MRLLALLCLFGLSLAQRSGRRGGGECEDLAAAKASLASCVAEAASEMEERKTERRAAKTACFVDNGCDDPSEDRATLIACKKAAVANGVGPVQGCLADKGLEVPDVLLGKLFKKGQRHLFGARGRRGGDKAARKEKKARRKEAKLDKYCSGAEANRAAAEDCLNQLREARKAAKKERKEARKERREQGEKGKGKGGKRKGLRGCMKALDRSCKRALMADLCDCAEPLRANPGIFADVVGGLKACKAKHHGEEAEEEEDAEVSEEVATARGKAVARVLSMVCGGKKSRPGGGNLWQRRGPKWRKMKD